MSGILDLPVLALFLLILIAAPILALVDIRKRHFRGAWRVYWATLIVLIPILGSLLYGLLGHRNQVNQ